jgi:hypothetical protein
VTAQDVSPLAPEGALAALVAACSIAFVTARAQRISCDRASFDAVLGGNTNPVITEFITTCAEKRDPSALEAVLVYQMIKGVWPSAFLCFVAHYGN